jgi:hypothetical protein
MLLTSTKFWQKTKKDETVKEIFMEMSDIEKGHAISFLKKQRPY